MDPGIQLVGSPCLCQWPVSFLSIIDHDPRGGNYRPYYWSAGVSVSFGGEPGERHVPVYWQNIILGSMFFIRSSLIWLCHRGG